MNKQFEDFQALTKNGYEAYAASAAAVTRGFQAMAQEATDFSKKSFEKGTEVMEKATAIKSVDQALQVQQNFAKDAYEAMVAQATKMNELYVSTAKEAFKPFEATMSNFGFKSQI